MATRKVYLFQNTNKENENQPDLRMCIKDENDDLTDIAAFWKEQGPNSVYYSGKLQKEDDYNDEGYWIVNDEEKKMADAFDREMSIDDDEDTEDADDGLDYPDDEDITPEDIPF